MSRSLLAVSELNKKNSYLQKTAESDSADLKGFVSLGPIYKAVDHSNADILWKYSLLEVVLREYTSIM